MSAHRVTAIVHLNIDTLVLGNGLTKDQAIAIATERLSGRFPDAALIDVIDVIGEAAAVAHARAVHGLPRESRILEAHAADHAGTEGRSFGHAHDANGNVVPTAQTVTL